MAKLQFSARSNHGLIDNEGSVLVDSAVLITRMAMGRNHSNDSLATKYSTSESEDYNALNRTLKEKLFKYCIDKAGLDSERLDINNKAHVAEVMSHPVAEHMFFSIITQALNAVNAATEVADIMPMANVVGVGAGDSWTGEIETKKLYNVEDASYGSNVTRFERQFRSAITLKPTPKSASVSFDVFQMAALGYDFGKEIAKIAMSFRTQMYQGVVDEIFTVANVSSTPFYKAVYAKTTYLELADRVGGANGSSPVAYGTTTAFAKMSDTVSGGFMVQDEAVKKGYITDLYGVMSSIIQQKVNTQTASYTFRVPTDRILLLSSVGDKPVKVVVEEWTRVVSEDGTNISLHEKQYKMFQSWVIDLATQSAYGIQKVS